MKNFTNYRYYIAGNKVIAVSTYAGKMVRGVAICSPEDNFDLEKGKALAAARCNFKVAQKRRARALMKLDEARTLEDKIMNHKIQMTEYFHEANTAFNDADFELRRLEAKL